MLSTKKSKTGSTIVLIDGKSICSTIDPTQEAKKWVLKNQEILENSRRVAILGAGAGYHIVEVCRQYPQKEVFLFENNEFLVDFIKTEFLHELKNVNFCFFKQAKDISKSIEFQKIAQKGSAIVEFKPSTRLNEEYFNLVTSILTGRNQDIFINYLEAKENRIWNVDKEDFKRFIKKMKNENPQKLLSVKDICHFLETEQLVMSKKDMIWASLKELVI